MSLSYSLPLSFWRLCSTSLQSFCAYPAVMELGSKDPRLPGLQGSMSEPFPCGLDTAFWAGFRRLVVDTNGETEIHVWAIPARMLVFRWDSNFPKQKKQNEKRRATRFLPTRSFVEQDLVDRACNLPSRVCTLQQLVDALYAPCPKRRV